MNKIDLFSVKYIQSFNISKFLLTGCARAIKIKFIQYRAEINKTSLLNMFWILFLLFGQMPQIHLYNREKMEKINHGALLVTKSAPTLFTIIKKITNFFLLTSTTALISIEKKNKSKIHNLVLNENSYFPELVHIPRLSLTPYDIFFTAIFTHNRTSAFEKAQFFRMLQIPVILGWSGKRIHKRKYLS